MNLDELQQAWKREGEDGTPLRANLEKLKQAHQPIDKIKRNMRKELIYQCLAILGFGVLPLQLKFNQQFSTLYYFVYTLLVIVSAYYLYRFYAFFRQMHNYSGSSKDNLYELYYEIRLNMEAYKSFSFLLVPFAIVAAILMSFNTRMQNAPGEELIRASDWFRIPITLVIMILVVIWLTNWWVNHFYGKHARKIRQLLDELKEVE